MVILQHFLHHLKLVPWYSLKHESTIIRIVEEGATLARGTKLRQRLKVALEDVAEDLFRTQTFQVLLFCDAREFANACKNLRCIVIESTSFERVRVVSLIGRYTELAADFVVLVRWGEHRKV